MNHIKKFYRGSIVGRCFGILTKTDNLKIVTIIVMQIFFGFIDLLGVASIGMLGSLAVRGVTSQSAGDKVTFVLKLLHIQNLSFQFQTAFLGCIAAFLLISRTLLSVFFSRRTLYFLSRRSAAVSSILIGKILSQTLLGIRSKTTQETLYAVTKGVDSITVGVIGITVTMCSDASLLIILTIGLFFVDSLTALTTIILFSLIGILLYKLLNQKAKKLGLAEANLTINVNEKIVEALNSYREITVRNRRYHYSKVIEKEKYNLAETLADIAFLPNVSKYFIESSVIISTLVICATQFILQDASHAVATLSVFMAATTRMAPAIMRIQQGSIGLRQCLGSANPTLELIEKLRDVKPSITIEDNIDFQHTNFLPKIEILDVSLKYPNNNSFALNKVNLTINPGEFVALVGPSGAGKTSLVDVLLGVIKPQSGEVRISNKDPLDAISTWPGAIAYVPQDVSISPGTIKENIGLGFPIDEINNERITESLEVSQLKDLVSSLPSEVNSEVGERGTKLSGGQRQRLGIARAIYTNPKFIVLDEATSALDGETELFVSEAIKSLGEDVTILTIAHRLSTVKDADKVVYMNEGSVICVGTFHEVRTKIPNFDVQAKLMGL